MRKFLFLLIGVMVFGVVSKAQLTEDEVDLVKSILKSEMKVFFAQNITLSTDESDIFWEIYDDYEEDLKPLANKRIKLLTELAEEGGSLTEGMLDSKIKEAGKIQKKRVCLRMKYYKKFKKKVSVAVASQFFHIDIYIYTHISAALSEGMPMFVPTGN